MKKQYAFSDAGVNTSNASEVDALQHLSKRLSK